MKKIEFSNKKIKFGIVMKTRLGLVCTQLYIYVESVRHCIQNQDLQKICPNKICLQKYLFEIFTFM